jgi:hypothetical protein
MEAYEERIKKQMEADAARVNAKQEQESQPAKRFHGNQYTQKRT